MSLLCTDQITPRESVLPVAGEQQLLEKLKKSTDQIDKHKIYIYTQIYIKKIYMRMSKKGYFFFLKSPTHES